ncbi:glycosyltransferase family 2 protein [Nocardia sp. SYP-A9097]|uniref:glycosyltransferase family 2 protein n=1 Tax=Nocardia sp. SYP-A9097 TaxID=2663237 RepID=UPI001890E90D|nr:glycosyltransferase family 2 protein [Nocardia sp. SYP-A9097]
MISIIIPTYNRPGPLHRALRSLTRQEYTDFEVIVVDDGGDQPARLVVDSWRTTLPIRLIENDHHGVSRARNTGLAAASGEFIAFLDDDDLVFPRHLRAAHTVLDRGTADAVYGSALVSSRWIETTPRHSRWLPRKDYEFDSRFLLCANYIHTGALMCRNFTDTPTRFTESMSHCEDWDLWLRLHRNLGYRFAYLGETTSVYHQVPQCRGAVSGAYLSSPTQFTLAHRHLFNTWPSTDQQILDYRAWFAEFDVRLDRLISCGGTAPDHIYESAVRSLYRGFANGKPADHAVLDSILPEHYSSGRHAAKVR